MRCDPVPPLCPVGLVGGRAADRAVKAGLARPLAGGPLAFFAVERVQRVEGRIERTLMSAAAGAEDAAERRLQLLARRRPPFAGLALDRPLIMGIVNVTPDSFADGGARTGPEAAVRHGLRLLEEGADFLDIGGESTRPGAAPVPADEQIRRVRPVIAGLAQRGALLSIDSRDPEVMAAALQAGARIINDVSALAAPGAIELAARTAASAVLVHMQGEPGTMQKAPNYEDVALEVFESLAMRLSACVAAGIGAERLAVDPGIGFGKGGRHNAALLDQLAMLHGLGVPLVLGASRKGWLGALEDWPPAERLGGSLAAAFAALDRGAHILRVHDVAQTCQVRLAWQALSGGGGRQ
jgi:dihydropteroate synthase